MFESNAKTSLQTERNLSGKIDRIDFFGTGRFGILQLYPHQRGVVT